MKELIINEYQAKHIEDTLRLVSNMFQSHKKETCLDRQIVKAKEMINEILKQSKNETNTTNS